MKQSLFLIAAGFLLLASTEGLAQNKPKIPLRQFTAFEVENFENPEYETKEPMPNDWIPLIREDVTQRVIQLHRFKRVMDFTDPQVPDPEQERVLVLRGKIVEFTRGSQAKRYLIGLGAGKGKIVAMCSFVDRATGEVIWQRKVDGRVIGAGESTEGAIKGLAKEIAKYIRNN